MGCYSCLGIDLPVSPLKKCSKSNNSFRNYPSLLPLKTVIKPLKSIKTLWQNCSRVQLDINVSNCDHIWQTRVWYFRITAVKRRRPKNHFVSGEWSERHYGHSVHNGGVDDACSAKWWWGRGFILECYMIGWQNCAWEAKGLHTSSQQSN